MIRKKSFQIYLLYLVISALFISCNNKQDQQKYGSFSAEVKFASGTQITVESFLRVIISHAMYSQIRTDVPQITYTYRDNLLLETGPYEIEVPFKIIKKVSFEIKKGNNEYDEYLNAKVLLGNNTEIEGRTWAKFTGKTNLGETTFGILDDREMNKLNITEIVFNQNALSKYDIPNFGKHNLDLLMIDSTLVNLKGAGFMKEKVNENGCYLDDEYSEKVEFKKAEGDYELEWKKIASISQENPEINLFNNFLDYDHVFKIKTTDNQELVGSCQSWSNAVHDIKALANINTDYNLLVKIPLYKSHYSGLVLKE